MDTTSLPYESKLFKTALVFLGLKWGLQLAIAGTLLAMALFALTTIVDATIELSAHLGTVWAHATGIERLIILCIAVLFIQKTVPLARRIYAWKVGR